MKRLLKCLPRILFFLLIALLLIMAVLQLPAVQTRLANKIMQAVAGRTGIVVHVDRVGIRFLNSVDIKGLYLEDFQGDTLAYARSLLVNVRLTGLLKNKLQIKKVRLKGFDARIHRLPGDSLFNYDHLLLALAANGTLETEQTDASKPWSFRIDKVVLQNVSMSYSDHPEGVFISAAFDDFTASPEHIDPGTGKYAVADITLSRAMIGYRKSESLRQPGVFNPDNFFLRELSLKAGGAYFSPDSIALTLHSMNTEIPDGFSIRRLSFQLGMGKAVSLDRLIFESDESFLDAGFFVGQPLDSLMISSWDSQYIMADITGLRAGRDIGYFVPEIKNLLVPDREPGSVHFSGSVKGRLDSLQLKRFHAVVPGIADLLMEGTVTALMRPDDLMAYIDTAVMHAKPQRVMVFFPEALIPEGIGLPDTLTASLSGEVSRKYLDIILNVASDAGKLDLSGSYLSDGLSQPAYRVSLGFDELRAGALANISALEGIVGGRLELSGKGLDPGQMSLDFDLDIDEATVKGYRYTSLGINGSMEAGKLDVRATYHDDMLSAGLGAMLDFSERHPAIDGIANIRHLDPRGLGLIDDTLALSTTLSAQVILDRNDFFSGYVRLDSTSLSHKNTSYSLDSIVLKTAMAEDRYYADLESGIALLNYSGNIPPMDLGRVMANHLGRYFALPFSVEEQAPASRYFNLDLTIRSSDWYTQVLFPDLHSFESFALHAEYDSNTDRLALEGSLPGMVYDNIHLSELSLSTMSGRYQMEFLLALSSLKVGGVEVMNPVLGGQVTDQVLGFSLAFDDMRSNPWFHLNGRVTSKEDYYELVLDGDALIQRETWSVRPDHYIRFGGKNLWVEQFLLSKEATDVTVQSYYQEPADLLSQDAEPSLALTFSHFDLGRFSLSDSLPEIDGILDGALDIHHLFSDPAFTSDLNIRHLGFRGDTVGDIYLFVESPSAGLFRFNTTVSNYGNQASASGWYMTGEEPEVALDVALTRFDLSTVAGLAQGVLDELTGVVTGQMEVRGKPGAPDFDGSLRFRDTGFIAVMPNTRLSLTDERINFSRNGITLSGFSIRDALGRVASLSGEVWLTDYINPRFDLSLESNNFLAMNMLPGQHELLSGRALVSSDLRLHGDLSQAVLEGYLKLNEGSGFLFKIPQSQPGAIGDEGIVAFMHPDSLFLPVISIGSQPNPVATALNKLQLAVNIEIDPQTDVRILIDEYAGDFLEVRGGGLISYGTDPGGRITMTGRYELAEGAYLLTFYDVIRRQFEISRGSTITWAGDPMNPAVDIRAVYNIRTSAGELFGTSPGGQQPDQRLRQPFPFQVLLEMKGSLLSPDIRFEIALPPEQQYALDGQLQARLNELNQNESERNKQVFALLMIGGFIHENPLKSGFEGPGLSAAARTSASKMLSQQLNRLSEQYIRGIDILFDVNSYEDFSGGEARGQTRLNLEVSKNFFDERLRVTVGGNIELEDENRRETNAGDIAGDFAIEYLLNPKGTLVLKGFRRKEFRDIFEGQVIETGVSLSFRKKYNYFRELFLGREKRNAVDE